jgi:hypothetical protein
MPNALPTLSTNIRSFAQETGAVAQNVFTNTPQALNNAWQNNENVVIEHSSNAQEHLNNIAAELKTKHVPKVSNEAKVAHEALSVDIPEAGGKLGEVEEEGVKLLQWIKDHARMCKQWGKGVGLKGKQWTESLALKCKQWFEHHAPQLVQWVKETGPKVVQWVKDNPGLVAAIVVAVVWIAICAAYPVLIPGVVVGAIRFVGFRLIGPLGGESDAASCLNHLSDNTYF